MRPSRFSGSLRRLASDYGILLALVLLSVYFSVVTYTRQSPTGASGGSLLAAEIRRSAPGDARVLVVVRDSREDAEFADALAAGLDEAGARVVETVRGQPSDARKALERLTASGERLDVIAGTQATAKWTVFDNLGTRFPSLAAARVMAPPSFRGSNFLKPDNLLNIANQIAVIAIVAIGMTLVIITGGIDLSVGSLIALSAVVSTLLIRDYGGAERAPAGAMLLACLAGVGICAAVGFLSGAAITFLRIPAFIVTLAMMLVASGLAFMAAKGQSIYQVPDAFVWLGRGADLGIPRAVWLMGGLYLLAHFLMVRTRAGRHVYAVGSNAEAARLSGVPVAKTLLWVYTLSGLLAGLGGVVMGSQLKSGSPTYGQMYELYVIAAVVVGGTSLSGGEGRIFGTLIGAFIIAVIQNGMNLTGVESYTQKVILGLVILGAVMLDTLKQRRWRFLARKS
jgi:ribose transport system permease protein